MVKRILLICTALSFFGCATEENPYNKKWRELGLNGAMVPSTVFINVEHKDDGGLVIECDKPCRGLFD
jgi:hypothetical protein